MIPLDIQGKAIDFFTPCLEDLVIAKLCSVRDTDSQDLEAASVLENLNWELLEHLATDDNEAKASAMNDRSYSEFLTRYHAYVERWKPCES